MGVHHDVMLGSLFDAVEVVVVHRLRVVVVATRDDVAHVARLHGVVAIAVHQRVGLLEVAFVVLRARRGLVVHEQFHALRVGIVVEALQVEVGVGGLEVEDVALPAVRPVFPAHVPALYEHLVESVLGSEVDVAAHFFCRSTMVAVGSCFHPVDVVELHGGELIGVVPRRLADNHLPPHTAVLRGVNPRGVVERTGLVEVEDEVRGEHVAGVVGNHHRAPRRLAGRLHAALQAGGVGSEVALEFSRAGQLQVHRGVVDAGRLMDVDVETIVGTHLQGSLHGVLDGCHRGVVPDDGVYHAFVGAVLVEAAALVERLLLASRDLAEARLLDGVFLRVVVGSDPPSHVVAGEGELRALLLDEEVVQVGLLRELVAQADAVVEDAEADEELPFLLGLRQGRNILDVVVADGARFAPYRLPGFVEGGGLLALQGEAVEEVGLAHATRGVLVAGQLEAQPRGQDDGAAFVVERVGGHSARCKLEGERQIAVGRFRYGLRLCGEQRQHEGCKS